MLWADRLYEQGEYDQYIQVVSALGDSDNTKAMIRNAEYAKAKILMENGAYEKAKTELQKLDGYEDSALLLKECGTRSWLALKRLPAPSASVK